MKQFTEHPGFLDILQILKNTFGKEMPDAIHELNGGGSTSSMFKMQFNNQHYVMRVTP